MLLLLLLADLLTSCVISVDVLVSICAPVSLGPNPWASCTIFVPALCVLIGGLRGLVAIGLSSPECATHWGWVGWHTFFAGLSPSPWLGWLSSGLCLLLLHTLSPVLILQSLFLLCRVNSMSLIVRVFWALGPLMPGGATLLGWVGWHTFSGFGLGPVMFLASPGLSAPPSGLLGVPRAL